MFKFKGKKWKEMNCYEQAAFMDVLYKWMLPIRIIFFPIALLVKLYKWTYTKE